MNSNVKEVKGCKEWTGEHGTVYYHALIMDNGDKLNIGKKKENYFKVGDSVEYEITGQPDDNGWCRAKHLTMNKGGFQREPFEHSAARTAITNAISLATHGTIELKQISSYADICYDWLIKKKQ